MTKKQEKHLSSTPLIPLMVVNKTKALGKNHSAIPIPNCVREDSRDKLSHIEGIIVKKIKAAPSLSHPQSRRRGNHPWGVIPPKTLAVGVRGEGHLNNFDLR